jgi:Flp pilus assembly protein TadG
VIPRMLSRAADLARPARFAAAEDGVAAVEFALVLPLMLTLYFGSTEVVQYINTSRKMTLAARTIIDLVAREQNTVSTDTLKLIVKAAKAVMAPYDASNAVVTIKAIGVYSDDGTKVKVCSSAQANVSDSATITTPASSTTLPTVPDAYKAKGARYVQVEMRMTYTPLLGSQFYNAAQLGALSEVIPWPVRNGTVVNSSSPEIVLPNGSACPANY